MAAPGSSGTIVDDVGNHTESMNGGRPGGHGRVVLRIAGGGHHQVGGGQVTSGQLSGRRGSVQVLHQSAVDQVGDGVGHVLGAHHDLGTGVQRTGDARQRHHTAADDEHATAGHRQGHPPPGQADRLRPVRPPPPAVDDPIPRAAPANARPRSGSTRGAICPTMSA